MIIWLASYPRSGSTLYRLLLHQLYGFDTYSVYNDPLLQKKGIGELMGQQTFSPKDKPGYGKSPNPHFIKTHGHREDYWSDPSPAIYIVRDGRATLTSYAHYLIDIENGEGTFEIVLHGLVHDRPRWGGWSGHVRHWLQRPGDKAIVHYEDLLSHPTESMSISLFKVGVDAALCEGMGKLSTFEELKGKYPKFFRTGKADAWRQEMSPNTEKLFWLKHGNTMEMLGYTR